MQHIRPGASRMQHPLSQSFLMLALASAALAGNADAQVSPSRPAYFVEEVGNLGGSRSRAYGINDKHWDPSECARTAIPRSRLLPLGHP